MKFNHWIDAHIHAYSFWGGVTHIIVLDNLKTGVIKNTRTELMLNHSYHEMAEHYGIAIIPDRPVKPLQRKHQCLVLPEAVHITKEVTTDDMQLTIGKLHDMRLSAMSEAF